MTDQSPLSIFISYSHDSDEHRERVLGLSERLRADGIETILDRYVERGSPPEGWPRWMLNGLEKATHVLCVCTETYYRRFRGREVPGKGKGVDWEGALMTQSLYDDRSVSTKCIPVLFARTDEPYVPEPLRGQTFYVVDSDASYEALYDALLNQSGVVPGPVGTPKRKPRATGQPLSFPSVPPAAEAKNKTSVVTRKIARTQLDKHAPRVLFGRETELAALDEAWAKGTLNVYTLVAWGGAGKTSLVFHWVQTRFAAKDWPGVERYFDWSFYSQGTGDSRQTSADLFIAKALAFFGDPDPTIGGPHERGERLAGLIRQHRTLLILDGIEPLQYPPNDPQAGRLKDPALDALLRELAADNPGLVVITTREHLTNVEGYATTEEQKLDKLAKEAAVALLRHLQIVGTNEELHAAWQDAGGHALTLSLLGRFIADAYDDRDIRHYREVKFEAADQEHQGRSAFKVMVAYERWLQSGGPQRQRELAVLRLTGLFDRPMAKPCLQALRAEPSIPGLTDALVRLTPQQWNIAVTRLCKVELLSVSPDAIDAHPLIREYFAAQLKRDQPETFQAAHSRLFDYLCGNTPHRPDGIDGLAPLYEAVTHGCLAGRQQEACDKVYVDRILRGTDSDGFYSTKKLGAIGADLAAVAAFFDAPWSQVSPNLIEADQAWLLNEASLRLRALGRLTEALQPMRVGLGMAVRQKDWKHAAVGASNLSELEVTLGRLPDAETGARQSITHADQSGDAFQRMSKRTTAADALHQSGQRAEAGTLFAEAERLQQERQPQFDLLYSLAGFRYCDWLLAPAEQAAWQHVLNQPLLSLESQISDGLAEVERRAKKIFEWRQGMIWNPQADPLLDIALDHLTLARVGLIRAILANPLPQPTLDLPHVATAVNGLRAAGSMNHLPRGLLTASLYHFVRGEHDLALKHLAEAQQIAERGPMPLYLADIQLTRARLFRDRASLSEAATLIRTLGYGRRTEELADAEAALALATETVAAPETTSNASVLPPALIATENAMPPITGHEPVVVLMTVNDHETDALLDIFLGTKRTPVPAPRGGVTYHELGLHGGLRVIHSLCEMGAGGIGAAQQRTQDAIDHWQARAVIAVGIAFGIDETKQQIGDVLVSVQLQDYELARVNADGTLTPRGDKPHAADTLVNRFRQTDIRCRRGAADWPKVRFGLVLSGQKLVDHLDYRESLKRLWSEAIGGEMEGTGLYASAQRAGADWLVVKAICDWGHNKNQANKDAWQKTAAANAARVVKAALDAGDLYPHKAVQNANQSDHAESPALRMWKKKLEFLLAEEAKAAGGPAKFEIQQGIEEARQKISELSKEAK
jgi:nucleoside phosphorylase